MDRSLADIDSANLKLVNWVKMSFSVVKAGLALQPHNKFLLWALQISCAGACHCKNGCGAAHANICQGPVLP